MAIMKKTITSVGKDVEKPPILLVGLYSNVLASEKSLAGSQNVTHRLPHNLALQLLCIYSRKQKTNTFTQLFTAVLLIKAKKWKQPKCSSING